MKSEKHAGFSIDELKRYYSEFMAKNKGILLNLDIQDGVNRLLDILNRNDVSNEDRDYVKKEILTIQESIEILNQDFQLNSPFLVAYDRANYLNLLEDANRSIAQLKEKLNPKKKFKFSKQSGNSTKLENPIESKPKEIPKSNEIKKYSDSDLVILNKADTVIEISKNQTVGMSNLLIENISNCRIYSLHCFKSLFAKNIKDSEIYIGSIGGGVHVTGLVNCKVYLACHQLRIHESFNTAFNVLTASDPILETSKDLVFADLRKRVLFDRLEDMLSSSGLDMSVNRFDQIKDFQWHKKEASPNFSIDSSDRESRVELNKYANF